MKVKRVQDYISKDWFDETDGSYFERLNSRLQEMCIRDRIVSVALMATLAELIPAPPQIPSLPSASGTEVYRKGLSGKSIENLVSTD